jgi:hypothetical protein
MACVASVVICLLGPLSVTGHDSPASLGPVQRCLLALLGPAAWVTTDQITDVLRLGRRAQGEVVAHPGDELEARAGNDLR